MIDMFDGEEKRRFAVLRSPMVDRPGVGEERRAAPMRSPQRSKRPVGECLALAEPLAVGSVAA